MQSYPCQLASSLYNKSHYRPRMSTTISGNPSYRKISSQDASASLESNHRRSSSAPPSTRQESPLELSSAASTAATPQKPFSERLKEKLVALCWVIAAILIARYTKLYPVLFHPSTSPVYQSLVMAALGCFATIILLLVYLVLYLPYAKGLTDSSAWPVYCPRVVPSIILLSVLGMILLIRACWPLWGCFSPLVLGTQVMGAMFSLHFVPWPC
jgi:hypothetical protein